MRHLSSAACRALRYFPHYLVNGEILSYFTLLPHLRSDRYLHQRMQVSGCLFSARLKLKLEIVSKVENKLNKNNFKNVDEAREMELFMAELYKSLRNCVMYTHLLCIQCLTRLLHSAEISSSQFGHS
jgi:hypothetical protein